MGRGGDLKKCVQEVAWGVSSTEPSSREQGLVASIWWSLKMPQWKYSIADDQQATGQEDRKIGDLDILVKQRGLRG